jgi:hypothetical protein
VNRRQAEPHAGAPNPLDWNPRRARRGRGAAFAPTALGRRAVEELGGLRRAPREPPGLRRLVGGLRTALRNG